MEEIIKKMNGAGLGAVYVGSTYGGEYHAPCPYCREHTGDGGKDRLCLWPSQGRTWCRRCKRKSSLAALHAMLTGMSETQALRLLGDGAKARGKLERPDYTRLLAPERWRECVDKLVRTRAKTLFTDDCADQLAYLHARGLTDDTICAARLGGCFENRYHTREEFGLAPPPGHGSLPLSKVIIPVGIVIPHFDAAGLCSRVLFRCDAPRHRRYRVLPGSGPANMVLLPPGEVHAVVVVESALDALLCHQEVPENFAFVALGSTAYGPDAATDVLFRETPHLLIATDSDEAGADAYQDLRERYPRASRLIVPPDLGKDIGEGYLAGLPIADWCEVGLKLARQPKSKPMTVSKPEVAAKASVKSKPSVKAQAKPVQKESKPVIEVTDAGIDVPYKLVSTRKRAIAAVEELCSAEYVAIDIETTPLPEYAGVEGAALDPMRARPRLLQATTGGTVYLFDLDKVALQHLAPLFQMDWVTHNAVFDYKHLLHAGLDPDPTSPFCTMLCDNALSNQNRSLADLFAVHFGIALDKELQTSDWSGELSTEQLRYAARDAVAVLRLWEKLRCEITDHRRTKLCHLLHDAQQAVATMELNGIGFDTESHADAVQVWKRERKRSLAALRKLAGEELNPSSHPQLAAFLETHLNAKQLKVWPRTDSGQLSTAAKEIAAFRDVPAVAAFLDYRHWSDLVGKFGQKLAGQVNPVTGRLHPHFRIAGARTGRMSASDPNVQGLPKDTDFRRLFIPAPGNVFVRADYNQMQLRIAALLSGDARLLGAYDKGRDVHRLTAASVLGKDVAKVTSEERSLAKAIGFGILFGMGARGLRSYALGNYGVAITESKAERIRDRFFETYPDVHRWQREQVEEAQRTGCSVTPMGRVRNFTREDRDDFHTAAMNTPIQGAEGEVMLAALAHLPEALAPLDALLVNCVHDELLVECPEENVEAVAEALRGCMERGMSNVFPKATRKGLVEVGHGPNWGDAK